MARPAHLLLFAALSVAVAGAETPRFVNSNDVVLTYRTANAASVTDVRLWLTTDRGRTWMRDVQADTSQRGCVRFQAPADGRYGFYVVLANEAGISGAPPTVGSKPQSVVVVDTIAPLLQLHRVESGKTDLGVSVLRLHVTLIDEHLHGDGVRLFYRTFPTAVWLDGGSITVRDDVAEWPLPRTDCTELQIRLLVTDLAGNRATGEIRTLRLAPPALPADPGVADHDDKPLAGKADQAEPAAAAATPPTVSLSDLPRVAALRRSAEQYVGEGRYSLAEARLKDALRLAPGDPDVLVALGEVVYRTQRTGDARGYFEAALKAEPTNQAAIEGLALVAATQRRYPEAREHLERLLRQAPESGRTWLHYGDMEHRLGNLSRAISAWQKAGEVTDEEDDIRAKVAERLKLFAPDGDRRLSASVP